MMHKDATGLILAAVFNIHEHRHKSAPQSAHRGQTGKESKSHVQVVPADL